MNHKVTKIKFFCISHMATSFAGSAIDTQWEMENLLFTCESEECMLKSKNNADLQIPRAVSDYSLFSLFIQMFRTISLCPAMGYYSVFMFRDLRACLSRLAKFCSIRMTALEIQWRLSPGGADVKPLPWAVTPEWVKCVISTGVLWTNKSSFRLRDCLQRLSSCHFLHAASCFVQPRYTSPKRTVELLLDHSYNM